VGEPAQVASLRQPAALGLGDCSDAGQLELFTLALDRVLKVASRIGVPARTICRFPRPGRAARQPKLPPRPVRVLQIVNEIEPADQARGPPDRRQIPPGCARIEPHRIEPRRDPPRSRSGGVVSRVT